MKLNKWSAKKVLFVCLGVLVLYAAYIGISLAFLPDVELLKKRRMSMTIQVRDWKGTMHPFVLGPKNPHWTPSASIPPEMKWAVILAEDDKFYRHEGIDIKAIKNAIKYDLEKKKLARGASTITQQTAKNIFLSREKSLNRKIKEVILARRMEEALTKDRILELYLNVVELGPMVYGIGHGASYYFNKPASALTPRECAFLAAMLPGPRVAYNPYRNLGKVVRRSDMILKLLRRKGVLSAAEYELARSQQPNIAGLQRKIDRSLEEEAVFATMSGATVAEPVDSALTPGEESAEPAAPEETPPVEPAEEPEQAAPADGEANR